jgi:hypothetical protein
MVGDYYNDKWKKWDGPGYTIPSTPTVPGGIYPVSVISRQEFDDLKKEVLDMKELLKRAVKYDEENNQPDCQIEDKIALLKKVAEMVGISLDDVLTNKKS